MRAPWLVRTSSLYFHRARALRHTSALLRYKARSLCHRYERTQFMINFSIDNHMISGSCNLWSLKKLTSAYVFQIVPEKSRDYVLII